MGAKITTNSCGWNAGVAVHTQLTAAADQKAFEQIVKLFVVSRGALLVSLQLLASQVPGFLIDDGWNLDRDPLLLGANHPAGIVLPWRPIARHISTLGRDVLLFVVVENTCVDGIPHQVDDCSTAPSLFAMPRPDTQFIDVEA